MLSIFHFLSIVSTSLYSNTSLSALDKSYEDHQALLKIFKYDKSISKDEKIFYLELFKDPIQITFNIENKVKIKFSHIDNGPNIKRNYFLNKVLTKQNIEVLAQIDAVVQIENYEDLYYISEEKMSRKIELDSLKHMQIKPEYTNSALFDFIARSNLLSLKMDMNEIFIDEIEIILKSEIPTIHLRTTTKLNCHRSCNLKSKNIHCVIDKKSNTDEKFHDVKNLRLNQSLIEKSANSNEEFSLTPHVEQYSRYKIKNYTSIENFGFEGFLDSQLARIISGMQKLKKLCLIIETGNELNVFSKINMKNLSELQLKIKEPFFAEITCLSKFLNQLENIQHVQLDVFIKFGFQKQDYIVFNLPILKSCTITSPSLALFLSQRTNFFKYPNSIFLDFHDDIISFIFENISFHDNIMEFKTKKIFCYKDWKIITKFINLKCLIINDAIDFPIIFENINHQIQILHVSMTLHNLNASRFNNIRVKEIHLKIIQSCEFKSEELQYRIFESFIQQNSEFFIRNNFLETFYLVDFQDVILLPLKLCRFKMLKKFIYFNDTISTDKFWQTIKFFKSVSVFDHDDIDIQLKSISMSIYSHRNDPMLL